VVSELTCPACHIALEKLTTGLGVIWRCRQCNGHAVNLSLLRKTFTPASINPLWLHAIHGEGVAGRACPSCLNDMWEVRLQDEADTVEAPAVKVEVCRLCEIVWFDAHESDALEPNPPTAALPTALNQVRGATALAKVESLAATGRAIDHTLARGVWGIILRQFLRS